MLRNTPELLQLVGRSDFEHVEEDLLKLGAPLNLVVVGARYGTEEHILPLKNLELIVFMIAIYLGRDEVDAFAQYQRYHLGCGVSGDLGQGKLSKYYSHIIQRTRYQLPCSSRYQPATEPLGSARSRS